MQFIVSPAGIASIEIDLKSVGRRDSVLKSF